MAYQVTARKWRPMVFEDVVGQKHITSTLSNAIEKKNIAHSYLFSGPRGCGKTTTARILAKAVNCLSPVNSNPDNKCDVCNEINIGTSLDVIEIDGASNRGVDDIRNLRDTVRFAPARGKYKVYVIDEVHMLTTPAFNALLKTLEEPPEHIIFIFATTEVHKVPLTILSRCQRFDFRRITFEDILIQLRKIASAEEVIIDEEALHIIARKGDGSMRDAQSIFDQVRAFCDQNITGNQVLNALNVVDQEIFFRLTELIKNKSASGGINLVDEVVKNGNDLREFVSGIAEHLRNILVYAATGSAKLIETTEMYKKRYEIVAKDFSENDLLRLLKIAHELEQSLRWTSNPRYKVESGILQMIAMERSVQIDDLLKRLDEIKAKMGTASSSLQSGFRLDAGQSGKGFSAEPPSKVQLMGSVNAGAVSPYSTSAYSTKPIPPPITMSSPKGWSTFRNGNDSLSKFQSGLIQKNQTKPQVSLEPEAIYKHWMTIADEVHKTMINLGSVLRGSSPLEIRDGALHIACPDDYHQDQVQRNREMLSEMWKKATGHPLRILAIQKLVEPRRIAEKVKEFRASCSTDGLEGLTHEQRILTLLKRELGAEQIS